MRSNILTDEAGWYDDNGVLLTGQKNGQDSSSEYNRIYNNVFYNIGYLPIFLSQRESNGENPTVFNYVTNNKIVNNILYQDETQGSLFNFPATTSYITAETYHSPDKPWPFYPYYNYFLGNLLGDDPGNNDLFQYTTATHTYDWNLTAAQGDFAAYISGNIQANPEFVDAANSDFRLAASSPAIGAGTHLAHTTRTGYSTTVPVDDPYFFMDGFGVVPGDSEKIGNNGPVTVTSVNYSGAALMVSSAVSFTQGEPVDLANFNGSAPDMGAFAYRSTLPEIFNLAATGPNATSASISWNTSSGGTSQVEYGTTSAYGQTSLLNTQSATSHAVVLSGLMPETIYHYAAISMDSSGARAISPDYTFTTARATGPVIGGPAVGNMALVGSGGSVTANVTISWSTDERATSQVRYSAGIWHRTYFNATPITNNSGSTFHAVMLTGLVPNATYHYAVRSTDSSGYTSYSSDETFTTPAVTAPGPVLSGITVTASSGATGWFAAPGAYGYAPSGKTCCGYSFAQVTIAWKTNVPTTHNNVLLTPISIGGNVDTIELNNSTAASVSGNPAATSTPSMTIYQLAPDTTYEVRVQSTDSSGHTTTSLTAEFTTPNVN